ncbi:DedA family protein [Euzebya tangerina]|uniref:DedA family protein n=1 Tax=Euzebya tangerina TaxID=591198 RepID=UPI000E315AF8|nr:DedA family protein [Euzebya tangerina]
MSSSAAAASSDFTGIVGWVVSVITSLGPVGVGLLLALDNVVPVVPSEVVLPFAGYLSSQERISFWLTLLAATVGSTASAFVYYEVGRAFGHERAAALLNRIPLVDDDDMERATSWFSRHGTASVLTGRCVPFVRSLISLPAGTEGMGRVRFGILTAIGSAVWNAVWLWLGSLIGSNWRNVGEYSDWLNGAILAALVLLIMRFVWRRRDRMTAD